MSGKKVRIKISASEARAYRDKHFWEEVIRRLLAERNRLTRKIERIKKKMPPATLESLQERRKLEERYRKGNCDPMANSTGEGKYAAFCAEHDLQLVDGRCSKCKDANGNSFVLDMQSTYLVSTGEGKGLSAFAEFDKAVKYLQLNGYGDWDGTAKGQEITLTGCANMMRQYLRYAKPADSALRLKLEKMVGKWRDEARSYKFEHDRPKPAVDCADELSTLLTEESSQVGTKEGE